MDRNSFYFIMGSRPTKVDVPHVMAVASPVAPVQQHQEGKHTNEPGPCHDHRSRIGQTTLHMSQTCDDINLKSPHRKSSAFKRRYSEPARTTTMTTELNAQGVGHLAAFESFVAERDLMAIDFADEVVVSFDAGIPTQETARTREEPEIQCVACCKQLPKESDVNYSKEVIKACRPCSSTYCVSCVRDMFLRACKDFSRMPARCCTQIHLHYIKPHLTTDEIAEYKSKYEEWSTPKPFYCPIPTCSVFIPERLLPQPDKRVDSGIGTPISPNFSCPSCNSDICFDCRQRAHAGSLCATLDLGIDAETAALLKAWGYKRCPNCSQGLKRMYGCSHMECRCGAHFCWGCMKSRDECEGGCPEDDEDEDNESNYEPDEPEPLPGFENKVLNEDGLEATVSHLVGVETSLQTTVQDMTEASATPRPIARPRNLDGGSARYWEDQDLDFGAEPTDGSDMTWDCHHCFEPFAVPLADALSMPPSAHEAECVKCWCVIQPNIEALEATKPTSSAFKPSRTSAVRGRGGRRGRGRGVTARRRPAVYTPPRGLSRSEAIIGTAPHLTFPLATATSRPTDTRPDPMEGMQSRLGPDFNVTTTSSVIPKSSVFSGASTKYSVAQECQRCSLLVCTACADAILARQETARVGEQAEDKTQPKEDTGYEDGPQRCRQVHVAPESDDGDDNQRPPSLFD